MTTPREPEGPQTGPSSSLRDRVDGDDTAEGSGADGQRPNPGTGPGGVPPWQRVGKGPMPAPGPSTRATDQDSSAPRPKPLVTGSAAPQPPQSAPTARAPIAKLDADGAVPESSPSNAERGRNSATGKVIDGPTRNIGRADVPEDLPDLDAIHHPVAAPAGSTRPVEAVAAGPRGPLRATVQLRRIDPWSAFKVSAVLSIALFLIWMIAIGVLYVVLDGIGVWDQINNSFTSLVSGDSSTGSSFQVTAGAVFGIAAGVGALYAIVLTALTTVGTFIYNVAADLVGGIEVTLADRD